METIDPSTTASVDKHNKFSETVFSYVDHVLGSKSGASCSKLTTSFVNDLLKFYKYTVIFC